MTKEELLFVPQSDMEIDDLSTVTQHQNLINNNKFSDATTLLDNESYHKGFRASLFNLMQNKIRMIQQFLLDKETSGSIEVYSSTEPTTEEMGDKTFWVSPY